MRILIASDGSEAAHRAGTFVAESLPGPHDVTVAVVLSYSLYPYREGREPIDPECQRRAEAESACASAKVVSLLKAAGNRVRVSRRFGYPPDELVEEIEESSPDLVVMGRRGLHGVARWLGSVSEHVLHHASVPVVLMP